jgi:hypothetical protein
MTATQPPAPTAERYPIPVDADEALIDMIAIQVALAGRAATAALLRRIAEHLDRQHG